MWHWRSPVRNRSLAPCVVFFETKQDGHGAWKVSASRYNSIGRNVSLAGVAELVDALVLGTSGESRGGSSPSARTIAVCRYFDGVIAWRETRRRKRATRGRFLPEVCFRK